MTLGSKKQENERSLKGERTSALSVQPRLLSSPSRQGYVKDNILGRKPHELSRLFLRAGTWCPEVGGVTWRRFRQAPRLLKAGAAAIVRKVRFLSRSRKGGGRGGRKEVWDALAHRRYTLQALCDQNELYAWHRQPHRDIDSE